MHSLEQAHALHERAFSFWRCYWLSCVLAKIDSYLNDQRAKIKGENRITTNSYKTVSRDRIPIKYKGQMYFESLEYQTTKDMDQLVFTGGKRIKKKANPQKDATENSDQDSDKESDDDNDEKAILLTKMIKN